MAFDEQCWKLLSPEARDLAVRMVAKNPEDRLTAREALAHPWFHMDHPGAVVLLTAVENMKKYNDQNRFNMEKIKPEFVMVTCTPLMHLRGPDSGPSSPAVNRNQFAARSPLVVSTRLDKTEEEKNVRWRKHSSCRVGSQARHPN